MINFVVNFFTFTSILPTKHRKRYYTFSITLFNYHPNTEILIFQKEKFLLPASSLPPTSGNPNNAKGNHCVQKLSFNER